MNRLAGETSPYLLQHADNPVDWYPWGEEAFAARAGEDRPIFLSIGYSACHWCHVMERESFEDPETAALMNEHFVASRSTGRSGPTSTRSTWTPVVALTRSGGWPLNRVPDARRPSRSSAAPTCRPSRGTACRSFRDDPRRVSPRCWRDRPRCSSTRRRDALAEHLRSARRASSPPGRRRTPRCSRRRSRA